MNRPEVGSSATRSAGADATASRRALPQGRSRFKITKGLCVLAAILQAATALADTAEEDGFLVERDNVEIAPAKSVHVDGLDVDNRLGDIQIIGRDQPGISLAVIKRAPDDATLDRLKVNLVPDAQAGVVRISTALLIGTEARPIATSQVRIDIKVFVPRMVAIQARAWNGKLAVTGTEQGATLLAHDGDIVVSNVKGPVTTTSMRGRQHLSDVRGVVSADDTFGDLALDEISGEALAARVHRGTVTATRVRSRAVSISTTFGDIEFRGELLAGGRYELRSYQGNVNVHGVGSARVDAFSRGGQIHPEMELRDMLQSELGRMTGSFGASDSPAVLLMSSAGGRVVFGLTPTP